MLAKYKIVPLYPYHFVHTILSNTILSVYHFVHTILYVPFCPLPFCPVTSIMSSNPIHISTNSLGEILHHLFGSVPCLLRYMCTNCANPEIKTSDTSQEACR